jgi:hypothetical protein
MGEVKFIEEVQVRAKALPLGLRRASGVYRVSHEPENVAASRTAPQDPSLQSSPRQSVSGRRETLQRALIALTRGAMQADGVSYADAGAQVDRQKQHVADMLSPDLRGKTFTAADLVLIGALCPSLQEAVNDYWRGGR